MAEQEKKSLISPTVVGVLIVVTVLVIWAIRREKPSDVTETGQQTVSEPAPEAQEPVDAELDGAFVESEAEIDATEQKPDSESTAKAESEPVEDEVRETKPEAVAPAEQEKQAPSIEDVLAPTQQRRSWGPAYQNWYGKEAPDFALESIQGETKRLSNYEGKNVILVFWATWCPPCKVEIPHLKEIREEISQDKLAILAISNEDKRLLNTFAENMDLNYTILLDRGQLPAPYSEVRSIPSTFFINPEGKIKAAVVGPLDTESIKMILDAE